MITLPAGIVVLPVTVMGQVLCNRGNPSGLNQPLFFTVMHTHAHAGMQLQVHVSACMDPHHMTYMYTCNIHCMYIYTYTSVVSKQCVCCVLCCVVLCVCMCVHVCVRVCDVPW